MQDVQHNYTAYIQWYFWTKIFSSMQYYVYAYIKFYVAIITEADMAMFGPYIKIKCNKKSNGTRDSKKIQLKCKFSIFECNDAKKSTLVLSSVAR